MEVTEKKVKVTKLEIDLKTFTVLVSGQLWNGSPMTFKRDLTDLMLGTGLPVFKTFIEKLERFAEVQVYGK
jgi:hypothetical protein